MCCHGNHAISHNQNGFVFEEHILILPLIGLIVISGINKKCSFGLNIGLIIPWFSSLSNGLALHFKFSLIFTYMQMRIFIGQLDERLCQIVQLMI